MTEDWRGDPREEGPVQRWLRHRWEFGSLYVLDIDSVIVSKDYERGMIIEWKHKFSPEKKWSFTRKLAQRIRFYGALFVYETDIRGDVVSDSILVTVYAPDGSLLREEQRLDVDGFDQWVREKFGE